MKKSDVFVRVLVICTLLLATFPLHAVPTLEAEAAAIPAGEQSLEEAPVVQVQAVPASVAPTSPASGRQFTQTFYVSADSYVCSSAPDTNYGTASYLRVSRMLTPPDDCRILVRFDLDALPDNADVVAATLELYSATASSGVRAHAALGGWKEFLVTWNNKPDASVDSFGALSAGAGWQQWNVKDFVQDWVDGVLTYNGFMMVQSDAVFGQTDYQAFAVGNPYPPRLVVTYQTVDSPMMLPVAMDTWINEAMPSTNYGTSESLQTRYDGYGIDTRAYILLWFDTSYLPSNITVISATLELYSEINRTQNVTPDQPLLGEDIYADTIHSEWDEMTVTWNYQKPVAYGDDPPSPYATGWMAWDVTASAQGWVSGTLTNYGIQLRIYDPAGAVAYFRGRPDERAPRLTIYYEPLPPVCDPMTSVAISGPTAGNTGTGYDFEAQITPLDATGPFTYTWTATDQSQVVHVTSNPTDTVTYSWPLTGTKTVNVTVENCAGSVSDNHQVTIAEPLPTCPAPLTGLSFYGTAQGTVDEGYSFRATAMPKGVTTPVTFTWQADGQSPVTVSGTAVQSTQVFTWSTLGPKAITVTATNCGTANTFVRYHTIDIVELWELPDLDVTTFWYDRFEQRIGFLLQNIGGSTAFAGHIATLDQGASVPDENIAFPYNLQPGAIREAYFDVARTCTSASELMQICADTADRVIEGDETNNCWQMTLPCDMDPPVITSGPTVVTTTETTATIVWQTNEPCISEVDYYSSTFYAPESHVTGSYVTDHEVTLTGLTPERGYHFYVYVTDMGGTSVNSDEGFFETQSPGTDAPVITYVDVVPYSNEFYDLYVIRASVDNIVGLDRIEFTYDGVLVKTEYFYPGHNIYANAVFSPHALGYTRATFFDVGHSVEVRAVNLNDAETTETQTHTPPPTPKHVKALIVTPSQGETIYVPGDPIPAGEGFDVVVRTGQYEWGCTSSAYSDILPAGVPAVICDDVESSVDLINLYVNGESAGIYLPGTDDYEHVFHLDLEGESTGTYDLELLALGGATSVSDTHTIDLVVGESSLYLERTVTRVDNYFEVEMTIANAANATLDADILQLFDDLTGFQVIEKTTIPGLLAPTAECQYYTINSHLAFGPYSVAMIDFGNGITLAPGASCTVSYIAMPVLYENMLDYTMGSAGSAIYFDTGAETLFAPSGTLNDVVADAFHEADYLIVTNPGRLKALYDPGSSGEEVNALLSSMARLAQIKRGALAYLDTYNEKQVFDYLIEPNGYWSRAMYPDFKWIRKGYMLIVGESEVVGAWTFNNLDLDWEESSVNSAPLSDHRYANTKCDGAPDLIVGRVIGNNPVQLRNVIQTSINVAVGGWSFDRTDALLVSGTGRSVEEFEDNVNDLKGKLENGGWNVVKLHWDDSVYMFPASFAQDFDEYDGFAAGDVIAGGKAEMVIAKCAGNHFIIRDVAGNTVGGFDHSFDAGDALAVGDVGWDDAAEIIVGDYSDGTIYIYGAGGGPPLGSINCGFAQYDGLATGYVMDGLTKAQILYGSATADRIYIYDQNGTSLNDFFSPFESHAGLAAGNVSVGYNETLEEIVVANADRIWTYEDDGSVVAFFDVDHNFEAGDRLAVGNVWSSSADYPEEIVIGDRNDNIYVYRTTGYRYNAVEIPDFEYYDGLAVADVSGDGLEEVLMADRDDRIKLVDAYYPRAALNAFKDNTTGKDVILFSGHGNTGSWGPGLSTGGFPLDFNNTKPFVFAPSCLTGNYERDSDNSIAESFLNNRAVAYIGATEISPTGKNSDANEWFFDHWDSTESVGSAFTQLEREVWEWNDWATDMWEFYVYEYNLYGDPKMGTDGTVLPSLSQVQLASPEAPTVIRDVHIPMYEVSVIDGADHVEIPGGQRILAQGQYPIPYWTESINYRPGTVVRDVTLVSRSGLTVTTGLSIPLTIVGHECVTCDARGTTALALAEDAWFPESEMTHDWYVTEGENGAVVLNIAVYPFFYNPGTQDMRFYRDFTFDIQLITTGVSIQSIDTDQGTYVQGDPVSVTLVISNAGSAQDVIVDATIKADPNVPVAGLPLRNLHDLSGWAEAAFTWDSTGIPAGDYFVEIKLRNVAGDVLDLETQEFTLGITDGEVTALTATPEMFTVGDSIAIALTFANTGTVPITGTAVIQVYPADVVTATATFTHAVTNLLPGASVVLNDTWDTTGATANAYRIVGYVNFNSMASAPKDVFVSTRAYIYLPLVLRNY